MRAGSFGLRTRILVLTLAGSLLAGCTFDPPGSSIDDPGDRDSGSGPGPEVDALPGPDQDGGATCTPGCEGDNQRVCSPEELLPCPLGCDASQGACRALVPSNGATQEHLNDVNAGLSIGSDSQALIHTDSGEIRIGTTIVRPAGEGIAAGVGFIRLGNGSSVVALDTLTIATRGTLRATGSRPLILLSRGDVSIQGRIDVSAACEDPAQVQCGGPGGGNGAAGSTPAGGCAPGGNGTGGSGGSVDETGGGGGGLGSDGAPGGNGGKNTGGVGGVLAGRQCPGEELVPLRGGSGGGAGGSGAVGNGGSGGGGGGAVQVTSLSRIAIVGDGAAQAGILASGSGGGGAINADGGGGGGSGGAILLEAPAIELRSAVLAANGGGGGGGGSLDARGGERGPFEDRSARGGTGANSGGEGASSNQPARAGQSGDDNTGGGGGGGAGIIRLNVPMSSLQSSSTVSSPDYTLGTPAAQ